MKERTKAILSLFIFTYSLWFTLTFLIVWSYLFDLAIERDMERRVKSGECYAIDAGGTCYTKQVYEAMLEDEFWLPKELKNLPPEEKWKIYFK